MKDEMEMSSRCKGIMWTLQQVVGYAHNGKREASDEEVKTKHTLAIN